MPNKSRSHRAGPRLSGLGKHEIAPSIISINCPHEWLWWCPIWVGVNKEHSQLQKLTVPKLYIARKFQGSVIFRGPPFRISFPLLWYNILPWKCQCIDHVCQTWLILTSMAHAHFQMRGYPTSSSTCSIPSQLLRRSWLQLFDMRHALPWRWNGVASICKRLLYSAGWRLDNKWFIKDALWWTL